MSAKSIQMFEHIVALNNLFSLCIKISCVPGKATGNFRFLK